MEILNSRLQADLAEQRSIGLDLGGGRATRSGLYAVDHKLLEGVDVVADLNQLLALFPDDCCEAIYSRHTLEHIDQFIPLMEEIYRITRPGGKIEIIVPHFSNVYGFSDPTHVRLFGLYSMYYFVAQHNQPGIRKLPDFYSTARFRIRSIRIEFYRASLFDKLPGRFAMFLNRRNEAARGIGPINDKILSKRAARLSPCPGRL